MINKNELRIGNWVMEPLGDYMKVEIIGHSDKPDYVFARGESGYGQNAFEPIPLSPDIIEKFGFEKEDQGYGYGDGEQVYRLVTQRGGYLFMILAGHQWCGAAYVKSVHHLQNLLFCLLGYEIEIQF